MSDEHEIIHRLNSFLAKKVFVVSLKLLPKWDHTIWDNFGWKKKILICRMNERVAEGGHPFTTPATLNGLLLTGSCKTWIAKRFAADDGLSKKCLDIK